MEQEILDGNKLIAEFMGVKIGIDNYSWRPGVIDKLQESHLAYHKEWGWLMPVVEKIETLEKRRFGLTIDPWTVQITDYMDGEQQIVEYSRNPDGYEPLIETLFPAIVDFIKFHNTQINGQ